MPVREMFIVAGPPGAGKSSFAALTGSSRFFNADDRAAELNAGSYQNIPIAVRAIVNREFGGICSRMHSFGRFVRAGDDASKHNHFRSGKGRASERISRGYVYIALDTLERHIERVMRRATLGGHSASEATLRKIHARSLANLPPALDPMGGIDSLEVYDNSRNDDRPRRVLESQRGKIFSLSGDFPEWLQRALGWTQDDLARRRAELPSHNRGM